METSWTFFRKNRKIVLPEELKHQLEITQAYGDQLDQLENDETMLAWFSLEYELIDEEEY